MIVSADVTAKKVQVKGPRYCCGALQIGVGWMKEGVGVWDHLPVDDCCVLVVI